MADDNLLSKVHGLSDLELAALLCLMNREHCLVSTPPEALDELIDELQLIVAKTFGLRPAVVHCTPQTTLDDFAIAILGAASPAAPRAPSPFAVRNNNLTADSYFTSRPGALTPLTSITTTSPTGAAPSMANVIIAKNLNLAPKAVQIQALELLRTRRIFTRTSVQAAPKQFLLVAALAARSGGEARVTPHLNDFLYLAHWHDPEDGFANLEEEYELPVSGGDAETASTESVVVRKSLSGEPVVSLDPLLSDASIATLGELGRHVQIDVDVVRYQMNIISYMRIHRAVGGGISPTATQHFDQLVKSLAPLHGIDYVTPALVALALKKVYLHRIQMASASQERSMQWGSRAEVVEAYLGDFAPEDVMDEVLDMVSTPL
ncbi:hypothetical protein F5X68DRAFT_276022 [Plectosphaerella plurivora]|uniref:magnesium chelatase n=1 Tax=Plectosphaerella plurivora TaxID=936078 RepID=A0A9P9AA09_9PEZI|nr:hypothetical protein F5X68DRAFT_276022 [Plectosphaerella plurivora]